MCFIRPQCICPNTEIRTYTTDTNWVGTFKICPVESCMYSKKTELFLLMKLFAYVKGFNVEREYSIGPFHANVNPKICRLEIVFDRLWYPLSILLLAAIGAKLIGPHGGLKVGKCRAIGALISSSLQLALSAHR